MNRMARIIVPVLAAVALSAGSAAAQLSIGVAGGPSFPTGDNHLDMGYHAQVSVDVGLPVLPVAGRIDGAFNRFGEVDGNYTVLSGTLNAILGLPLGFINPYAIGGVGVYSEKDDAHGEERETNLGFNVGLGINLPLPGLGFFAEARLHNIGGGELRYVPVSLGIRF
jgi:hypothetical protein